MAYSGNTGIRRLLKAMVYSWQGFCAAFKHEEAFRQELLLAIVLIPSGLLLGDGAIEKLLLVGSVILLLMLMNDSCN